MKFDIHALERSTGYRFKNDKLFEEAFTHTSYMNESRHHQKMNNERLEFLGDAVLQISVSDYLFHHFPHVDEGELTKYRASIVCEPSLASVSRKLNFGRFIILGKGEERTGGRNRASLLADLFEAFVGALYLDQGLDVAKQFLNTHLFKSVADAHWNAVTDYKSALQVHVQNHLLGSMAYEIISERGPSHDREFEAQVTVDGEIMGSGIGRSKKEAEQAAARQALLTFNVELKK